MMTWPWTTWPWTTWIWAWIWTSAGLVLGLALFALLRRDRLFGRDFWYSDEVDDKASQRYKPVRVPTTSVVTSTLNRRPFSLYNNKVTFSVVANSIPDTISPLLCFVNPKSGGNQGRQVIKILSKLLHPVQVIALEGKIDPLVSLNLFAASSKSFRVLVCGGDGSVGWILSCISKMQKKQRPPVAILPLGTGNDLARSLGWGYTCVNSAIPSCLDAVMHASTILLDRWQMSIKSGGKILKTSEFSNYCGFGVDAQVAHKFHEDRNSRPDRFVYQFFNKVWYGVLGAEEIWKKSCKGLFRHMQLFVDGNLCPIPEETEGIIFCNITSYGGGVKLWNDNASLKLDIQDISPSKTNNLSRSSSSKSLSKSPSRSRKQSGTSSTRNVSRDLQQSAAESTCGPQSIQDGFMECMAVKGTLHLAQIKFDLDNAIKLQQGKKFTFVFDSDYSKKVFQLPIQTDGEPWIQSNLSSQTTIEIERVDQSLMLERTPEGRDSDLGSEIINWAFSESIIDFNCKTLMQKEFSRRLEDRRRLAALS